MGLFEVSKFLFTGVNWMIFVCWKHHCDFPQFANTWKAVEEWFFVEGPIETCGDWLRDVGFSFRDDLGFPSPGHSMAGTARLEFWKPVAIYTSQLLYSLDINLSNSFFPSISPPSKGTNTYLFKKEKISHRSISSKSPHYLLSSKLFLQVGAICPRPVEKAPVIFPEELLEEKPEETMFSGFLIDQSLFFLFA